MFNLITKNNVHFYAFRFFFPQISLQSMKYPTFLWVYYLLHERQYTTILYDYVLLTCKKCPLESEIRTVYHRGLNKGLLIE